MDITNTLVIGQSPDAERRIEARVDENGSCSVHLFADTAPPDGFAVFPCILENLRMVLKGLSYQANSSEGFISLSRAPGEIHIHAKPSSERSTWFMKVPVEEFENKIHQLEKILSEHRHGYVA